MTEVRAAIFIDRSKTGNGTFEPLQKEDAEIPGVRAGGSPKLRYIWFPTDSTIAENKRCVRGGVSTGAPDTERLEVTSRESRGIVVLTDRTRLMIQGR